MPILVFSLCSLDAILPKWSLVHVIYTVCWFLMMFIINKLFPSMSCLYITDLLSGRENVVINSDCVIKFCFRVTDVSWRSLSEIQKVIKLAKDLLNSWGGKSILRMVGKQEKQFYSLSLDSSSASLVLISSFVFIFVFLVALALLTF